MKRLFQGSLLLLVLLAGSTPLLAHHGNASYENKEVTIKGKVTNWIWSNPHTFLMLDVWASSELAENISAPMASYLYAMSTMHCMSVSLAAGGPGLGTAWGHQTAMRMLREAGFADVQLFERVDPANSLYVARRGV